MAKVYVDKTAQRYAPKRYAQMVEAALWRMVAPIVRDLAVRNPYVISRDDDELSLEGMSRCILCGAEKDQEHHPDCSLMRARKIHEAILPALDALVETEALPPIEPIDSFEHMQVRDL